LEDVDVSIWNEGFAHLLTEETLKSTLKTVVAGLNPTSATLKCFEF